MAAYLFSFLFYVFIFLFATEPGLIAVLNLFYLIIPCFHLYIAHQVALVLALPFSDRNVLVVFLIALCIDVLLLYLCMVFVYYTLFRIHCNCLDMAAPHSTQAIHIYVRSYKNKEKSI